MEEAVLMPKTHLNKWRASEKESIHNIHQFLVKANPTLPKKKTSNLDNLGGVFLFDFHPCLGKISILTIIFCRWVETAN